jgi:beta-glucanase (GH16 family)
MRSEEVVDILFLEGIMGNAVIGFAALAFCAVQAVAAEATKPLDSARTLDGYNLVWSDEFNGTQLDTKKWDFRTDVRFWSEQLPENVSVKDGSLLLHLKKEKRAKADYTAGGVISKRTFKYGYYEARFKCPPKPGWHTSFWMMLQGGKPVAARQEIDVCETDSVRTGNYSFNLHEWEPEHKGHKVQQVKTPDLSADFHIWGCEFTPTQIRFFFDGKLVGSRECSTFKHDEQNVWLTSIASPLGGTKAVDENALPAYAYFDWVRVYEKD